jgi:hypothetical protein
VLPGTLCSTWHCRRHQRHVHVEQRPAFRNDEHVLGLAGGDDHLALFAARLVVVLHAPRALRLQAADVGKRIVEIADLGEDSGGLGSVDDLAGREDSRRQDQTCPLHFRGRENVGRAVRRIVDRGRAERQIGLRRPVLLRHQTARPLRSVRVSVDEARDDRLPGGIDGRRARRNRDASARTDGGDAVALLQDRPVLDDSAVGPAIVTIRAPVSATLPVGLAAATVVESEMPDCCAAVAARIYAPACRQCRQWARRSSGRERRRARNA